MCKKVCVFSTEDWLGVVQIRPVHSFTIFILRFYYFNFLINVFIIALLLYRAIKSSLVFSKLIIKYNIFDKLTEKKIL